MVDMPEDLVTALVGPVTSTVRVISERIPAGPAGELGRIGAPADSGVRSADQRARAAPTRVVAGPVVPALQAVGPLLAERLLGALELTVPTLDPGDLPDLGPYLGTPPAGRFAFARTSQESAAVTAATMADRFCPGVTELALALTEKLSARGLATIAADADDATDEAGIAAAHGTAYLALAVAVTNAALAGVPVPGIVHRTAAVVGIGIGVAAVLLGRVPMPDGYARALLAKARAEYRLPRRTTGSVPVTGHRFALAEGEVPADVDFGANGLVAVVPGGIVVRTGVTEDTVRVRLDVVDTPPDAIETEWDDVVEVSWQAAEGRASIVGGDRRLRYATPPWPGDYRIRVHATGRDDGDEHYRLTVWQAPAAPEIRHRATDMLGQRLRGERTPTRAERPELAYRWMTRSALGDAATVTLVTGSTADDVVRAFGADPDRPVSLDELLAEMSVDPWVAVLDLDGAVLALEFNGWQGSTQEVLTRASAGGRAASMFWNVNAMTRLSFAERGAVLASFEPPYEDVAPEVAAMLVGLRLADYRDKRGKGLVAVERFTGRGMTADDLARVMAADVAFRIMARELE